MPVQSDKITTFQDETTRKALQSDETGILGETPIEVETPAVVVVDETAADTSAMAQNTQHDIEQLQQAILNSDNFDFNQLEAPAAGTSDNVESLSPENGGHPSIPIIELPDAPSSNNIIDSPADDNRHFDVVSPEALTETEITDESALISATIRESDPDFLGDAHANVTEDFLLSAEGKVGVDVRFLPDTLDTQCGEISYNEQGDWRYTLDNNLAEVQQLGAGDTLNESIELNAINGDQFLIEVTINGSNDQAFISGTNQGMVKEDAFGETGDDGNQTVAITGQLEVQDLDAGEARFATEFDIATTYGSAEINALGQWRYELNNTLNPVQGLKEGQTLTDYFTVNTLDGSSKLIQITIEGSNDTPILTGSNFAQIDLGTSMEASGNLSIDDPDFGESYFLPDPAAEGSYGVGSIDENGQWLYQVDNNHPTISALGDGERVYDTFIVLTADGTEKEVIIKIDGSETQISSLSQPPVIELSAQEPPLAFSLSSLENPEADVYIWNTADNASDIAPDTDHIANFVAGDGGDILQLNDLLIESSDESELEQFLHFSFDGQDTTLEIRPEGSGGEDSHFLVLNNVDLTSFGNSDNEIIDQLINNGNLDIAGL